MRPLQLKIENCFSYESATLDFKNRGVVLVTGWSVDDQNENGSGKSSLISKALCWWLFGRTPHGLKGDDITHRPSHATTKNKKTSSITGNIIGKDNKQYTITRSKNPSKLQLLQGKTDISSTDSRITQRRINSVLGRTFESFIYSDIFGQHIGGTFLNERTKVQREILDNLIPYNDLDHMIETAKNSIDKVVDQYQRIQIDIESLETQKDIYNGELHRLLQDAASFKEKKVAADTDFWKELRRSKLARLHYDQLKEELSKIKIENLDRLLKKEEEIQNAITKAKTSINAWEREIADWKLKLKKLGLEKCYVCNSLFDPTSGWVLDSKSVYKQKIAEGELILNKWNKTLQHQVSKLNNIKKAIQRTRDNSQTITNGRVRLAQLKAGTTSNTAQYIRIFKDTEEQEENFNKNKLRLRDSIKNLGLRLDDRNNKKQTLTKEKEHLEYWYKTLQTDFKLALINNTLQYLNDRTKTHLQGLGNAQLHVEFDTIKVQSTSIKDDLGVRAWSDNGGRSLATLSGGEQQLINFAVGLSLSDLASTQTQGASSILILDEPFENLSPKNAQCVVNYLTNTLANEKESIFLISHVPYLKALIPNNIHVVKQNGISKVQ